jgi:hypothetical protein
MTEDELRALLANRDREIAQLQAELEAMRRFQASTIEAFVQTLARTIGDQRRVDRLADAEGN